MVVEAVCVQSQPRLPTPFLALNFFCSGVWGEEGRQPGPLTAWPGGFCPGEGCVSRGGGWPCSVLAAWEQLLSTKTHSAATLRQGCLYLSSSRAPCPLPSPPSQCPMGPSAQAIGCSILLVLRSPNGPLHAQHFLALGHAGGFQS